MQRAGYLTRNAAALAGGPKADAPTTQWLDAYQAEKLALGRSSNPLGLPRIRQHDLRHSTATLLLERGISSMEVATLLGHSTTRLTDDRYGHLAARMTEATAAAVDTLKSGSEAAKLQMPAAAEDGDRPKSLTQQGLPP